MRRGYKVTRYNYLRGFTGVELHYFQNKPFISTVINTRGISMLSVQNNQYLMMACHYPIIKRNSLFSKIRYYKFRDLFNNLTMLLWCDVNCRLQSIYIKTLHFCHNCSTKFLFAQLIRIISHLINQLSKERK